MKIKIYQKALSLFTIIAMMVAIYGFIPLPGVVQAVDSITDAQDLISDSDLGMPATHTFTFTTGATTTAGGYWEFYFDESGGNFSGVLDTNTTCAYGDANFTASSTGDKVHCVVTADEAATSTQVVVTDVTNPSSDGYYKIGVGLYDASDVLIERVDVMVYIINDVLMTATVDSTLQFTINGINTNTTVNNIDCTATSTSETLPFGTLVVNATSTVCQRLNVITNADDGYTVTVEQDHEMLSDAGSNINSFNNAITGSGTTTAETWQPPLNTLDEEHTYGHMGLTSDDQDLNSLGSYNDFYNSGDALYVGLSGTDPMPIMHHDGPSDGTTTSIGQANVAYSTQVASLQEAGDYESMLTYICTPTY